MAAANTRRNPATGEWEAKVKELHRQLIEHIAESDDALMNKFFEQGSLSEEEFRAGIHAAVQKELFIPLFARSAENNIGVARLMDFIAKYGSSPVDRKKVKAVDANGRGGGGGSTDPEPVLYIFKTMSEAHFGELSFFRVYSGSVSTGMDLYNSDRKINERIGQIYLLNGQTREAVNTLGAGDIGAAVKLKDTHTGNTLCHAKKAVTLPKVVYPKPNIHASLVAKVKGEEDKIASGLAALHNEDPTFLYVVDANCTRPSSPRRANCIWKSSPTVCAAGTTSTSNSPSRA
jgi:elongation factor G